MGGVGRGCACRRRNGGLHPKNWQFACLLHDCLDSEAVQNTVRAAMQAPNADHLFRSDAELEKDARRQEKAVRTAKAGDPITLGSKPLDLIIRVSRDAAGTTTSHAYIAESGFQVRKLNLEVSASVLTCCYATRADSPFLQTGKTTALFKGHTGPVTSLAFYNAAGQSKSDIMFSGSWDKSIRATETLVG